MEALKSERAAMLKLLDQLRKDQKPKLSEDERYLKAVKSRLKTTTEQLQRKLAAGDFESKARREVKPDQEYLKLKAENTLAKEAYLKALFDARMAARPKWKKFVGGVAETLNTSRAVLTAFDLSAVLRQGGFIALGNPVRAAKALGPMFRALRSEKNQVQVMEEIRSRPTYALAEKAKLFLSDEGALSLTKMEEAYAARWASKIPGVGASGRAYTTFLNKLRMDTFDSMIETLTKNGTPTAEEAKAIANYINVATGRGSIHSSLAQATAGLNTLFFAPRYVTSRFQLLLGQPLYGGSARTRRMVAQEYGKFLTGASLVIGLGLAAGAQFNTDPKSSDFGKLKFGNTRVDLLSGLLQATTFGWREISGKTTNNQGVVQDLTKLKKGPYDPSRLSVGMRFLRTKLAPIPGNVVSLMEQKDLAGKPFGLKEAALNSVVPISFGDIYKVMEEQGVPKGTILSILSLFGAGVQTYDEKKKAAAKDIFSERRSKKDDLFLK